MKKLLVLLVLIIACQPKEKKGQVLTENNNEVNMKYKPISITCYLLSLDGEQEIYTIKQDSIYFFGKTEKLDKEQYEQFRKTPDIIYNKGNKYGCGVCTDGVDYRFIFSYKDKETIWEIEPGSKLPYDINEYFNLLENKYKELISN